MVEFALAASLIAGQPDESATITRILTRIEKELAAAWRTGDCESWGAIIAPEWSVIHISGTVITRAQALQMCQGPQVPIETMSIDQISVRSFGDATVVTGRTIVTTGGTNPETLTLRFTDVFVRRGRPGWQVVASHATRVVPD